MDFDIDLTFEIWILDFSTMPIYNYIAKNSKGKEKKGIMHVKDEHALARRLRSEGYILTFIEKKEQKNGFRRFFSSFNIFQRVSLTERMFFAKHLGLMIKSGVPLSRALSVLAKQTKSAVFANIINHTREDIQSGKSLSEALKSFPNIFNEFFVSMIEVGEAGGNFEDVLDHLANQMKKEHDLISKVRGAMLYPLVILAAMAGIGILMMVVVVPSLIKIFEELETELPMSTQMLIKVSNLLVSHGWIFLGLFITLMLVLKFIGKTRPGKKFFQSIIFHIPVIGGIVIKINLARFARNLGSLVESGEAILKSFNVVSKTLGNIYYRESIKEISCKIEKGFAIHETLSEYPKLYPPLITQMIEVGEETGTLSETLNHLAEFYEGEVDQITKNLSSIIEPILLIIIGIAVALFAISVIQPMYSLSSAL